MIRGIELYLLIYINPTGKTFNKKTIENLVACKELDIKKLKLVFYEYYIYEVYWDECFVNTRKAIMAFYIKYIAIHYIKSEYTIRKMQNKYTIFAEKYMEKNKHLDICKMTY